jgi:hypothetical protein
MDLVVVEWKREMLSHRENKANLSLMCIHIETNENQNIKESSFKKYPLLYVILICVPGKFFKYISVYIYFIYSYVHKLFEPFLPLVHYPLPTPHFQAEPVLPSSPILMKKRHNQ